MYIKVLYIRSLNLRPRRPGSSSLSQGLWFDGVGKCKEDRVRVISASNKVMGPQIITHRGGRINRQTSGGLQQSGIMIIYYNACTTAAAAASCNTPADSQRNRKRKARKAGACSPAGPSHCKPNHQSQKITPFLIHGVMQAGNSVVTGSADWVVAPDSAA